MKEFVNPAVADGKEFIVSCHAVERFLERKDDPTNPKDPVKTIKKLFRKAYEIRFSPAYQFKRLLSNGVAEAKYYYNNKWIFVYSAENRTIVTVEKQNGKEFGIDLFKTEEILAFEAEIERHQEEERMAYIVARNKIYGIEERA